MIISGSQKRIAVKNLTKKEYERILEYMEKRGIPKTATLQDNSNKKERLYTVEFGLISGRELAVISDILSGENKDKIDDIVKQQRILDEQEKDKNVTHFHYTSTTDERPIQPYEDESKKKEDVSAIPGRTISRKRLTKKEKAELGIEADRPVYRSKKARRESQRRIDEKTSSPAALASGYITGKAYIMGEGIVPAEGRNRYVEDDKENEEEKEL